MVGSLITPPLGLCALFASAVVPLVALVLTPDGEVTGLIVVAGEKHLVQAPTLPDFLGYEWASPS